MMIKWVMALDYDTAMKTLTSVLINDVVKGKIRGNFNARGNDLITFRSRIAPEIKVIRNLYPFDDVEFSQATAADQSKKSSGQSEAKSSVIG